MDFEGNDRERIQAEELGARVLSPFHLRNRILPRSRREIARLHAEQLKVALRLYQAEQGKPAESLAVLVPKYLPSIPLDPFDGNPFRYRLSRGERIEWFGVMTDEDVKAMEQEPPPPPPAAPEGMMGGAAGGMGMGPPAGFMAAQKAAFPRLIPKGQGILWSVGEDGNDDGGTRQDSLDNITQAGEDILYLVPLAAK